MSAVGNLRVVCCCLAMLSAGPATVADVAAQTSPDEYHLNRDVAEACSLRNTRRCARLIARVWDRFSSTALSALPTGFRRDGAFPEPKAPALMALSGFATPTLRSSGCGQLPVSREQLTRLLCNARDQLRPHSRTSWARENRRLEEVQRLLVDAQCLPVDALDLCPPSGATTVVLAAPDESDALAPREALESATLTENIAPIDLAGQGVSKPLVDLQ